MTEIQRDNFYDYLKKECSDCYIGLTKINDVSKIFSYGLWNDQGDTIADIVNCFELSDDNKDRIESYGSNGDIVIICAIPIVFSDSKGRKLFGGIRNCHKKYLDEKVDCISDYLFKNTIPKEMIFGYCEVKKDKFILNLNSNYYNNLIPVNKDSFIDKYFDVLGIGIDINEDIEMELDDSAIPSKYKRDLLNDINDYLNR